LTGVDRVVVVKVGVEAGASIMVADGETAVHPRQMRQSNTLMVLIVQLLSLHLLIAFTLTLKGSLAEGLGE
jgi:hypothetical protein